MFVPTVGGDSDTVCGFPSELWPGSAVHADARRFCSLLLELLFSVVFEEPETFSAARAAMSRVDSGLDLALGMNGLTLPVKPHFSMAESAQPGKAGCIFTLPSQPALYLTVECKNPGILLPGHN